MAWLKFDTATPEKPEIMAITLALGFDDPDLTVGKLLKVWRWFDQHSVDGNARGATAELGDEVQNCLRASSGGGDKPHVLTAMQVRRLTPTEAERLMGFPDGYTAIPWRGKTPDQCPDGPRYKSLGNSWAVPVAAWVGKRIQELENGRKRMKAAE